MSNARIPLVLCSLLTVCCPAIAEGPDDMALPAGCVPHMQSVDGGEIDWGGGYIVAIGRGEARGTSDQDRHMARRAAEVVAARNVLAVACGVRVDADGCLADVQNGEVRLRGVLKGHKTISVDWRPNEQPPVCYVRMRAPLWGAKGAATIISDAMCAKARRATARRLPLAAASGALEEMIVVIDARGVKVHPCMFPSVLMEDGAILYDVATITGRPADLAPTVRYVETKMTFNELRADAQMPIRRGHMDSGSSSELIFQLCNLSTDPAVVLYGPPTSRPTTMPATTQPADDDDGKSRRRKRRVVRALKTPTGQNTQIVLTKEDAESLRQDPKTAAALKNGRVVVVVDSVAAGIEGRAPTPWDDNTLARADRE